MRLVSGPAARDVPFLPGPAGGLEMRVGGDGGYAWKRLDDLSAIDLPVRIDAPQAATARLAFDRNRASAVSGWRALLIDLASGTVLDPPPRTWPFPPGPASTGLVAGSEGFVQERVSRFRAGLPADLILSQNAPNPVRGITRIALDWPAMSSAALSSGAGRRSYLEVFDARGKRMQKLDLGRAWRAANGSPWTPPAGSRASTPTASPWPRERERPGCRKGCW